MNTQQDPENPQPQPISMYGSPQLGGEPRIDPARGFPIWTASRFAAYTPPADLDVLGTAILRRRQLCLLMGQPKLGKSTLAFALAVANVRGDTSFGGIPLTDAPYRWLFIGTENGVNRWKSDFDEARPTIDPSKLPALEERIMVAGTFDDADPDLTLPRAEERIAHTIASTMPDVIVLDPWSDLTADEVASDAVRAAIRSIRSAVRRGKPDAAILLICHAKSGREAIADFVGNLGAINAQRGNRALTASARAVLLALPHADDDQDLVLTLPACNDGPPLAPRRLRFDRNKFAYRTVEPFCVDEWRNGLRAKPQAARKVPVDALMAVVGDGLMHTREIVRQLRSKASERSIKAAIAEAVDTGRLMQVSRGQYRSMAVAAKPTGADGATADA